MHTEPTTPPPFTLLDCACRQLTPELCRALPRAPIARVAALQPGLPPALELKWTSKADNMMRQANAATRSLLRLQATRRKLEADPKACDRGERIKHQMRPSTPEPPAYTVIARLA